METTEAAAAAVQGGITFLQAWEWGGWIMWVLAGLSVLMLALVIYLVVAQGASGLVPRALSIDVLDAARKGDVEAARRLADRQQCAFSELAAAAADAAAAHGGAQRVRQAVESAGAHIAERMNMSVEYLLDIAAIAPLAGLLGTVLGMFRAFGSVATDIAAAKPVALAQGVTQALVTTVFGLVLAIPALAAYAFLRRRAARRIAMLETAGEELAAAFEAAGAPAAPEKKKPPLDTEALGRLLKESK